MAKGSAKKHPLSKKDLIVQKAGILFMEKGFRAASMRDLAEGVGMEAASLYNHIQSKAEILQGICFQVANAFMAHLDRVRATPQTTLAKLEEIIRFHIRMMLDQYEFVYISDHEWRHLTEPYLSNFLNQRRLYRQSLADLVQEGIQKGEVKKIDAYVAVLTSLSAISGIESWHRSRKQVSAEDLESNMVRFLIEGLKR